MRFQYKRIFLIVYSIGLFQLLQGQVVNVDSLFETHHLIVTQDVELLKTKAHLPIDSILNPSTQAQFVKGKKQSTVYLYFDPYYYWFRLVIRNDQSVSKDLVLIMPPFGLRDGKLFQKQLNHWTAVAITGYSHPFMDRSYQYAHYAFPFTLAPHTVDTFYIDMDASKAYKSYAFALINQKDLKIFESRFYFSFGIILGLFALFCLLNLYLNFIYKDRIHLWYSLYIGILMLIVMKHDQLDQQFFGWDSAAFYKLVSTVGISALAIGLLIHVVQTFLSQVTRGTVVEKILILVKYNILLSGFSQLIVFYLTPDYHIQNLVWYWAIWSIRIGILTVILSCVYSIFKGYKLAIFILVGLIVFLIGSLERIMLVGSSSYLFPPTLFHIGMVLEVFIISFGLIFRYRIERRKRNIYEAEKRKLKTEFDEELLKTKIAIQEQTIQNTFKEINENIGKALGNVHQNILSLKSGKNQNAEESLNKSKNLLVNTIASLRSISKTLDTDYIMENGLRACIEHEMKQRKRLGAENLSLNISGTEYRADPHQELILFRIYQQVANKVAESDGASLLVSIFFKSNKLELEFSVISGTGQVQDAPKLSTGIDDEMDEISNLAMVIGGRATNSPVHNGLLLSVEIPVREYQGFPQENT